MAQLWGTMALRLANAEVLPLDFDAYAGALRDFIRRLDDIPGLARERRRLGTLVTEAWGPAGGRRGA